MWHYCTSVPLPVLVCRLSLPIAVIREHAVFVLVHVNQFLTAKTSAIEASVLRCISIPGNVLHEATKMQYEMALPVFASTSLTQVC